VEPGAEPPAGQAESAPGPSPEVGFEAFWLERYRYHCTVLMTIGASLADAEETISYLAEDILKKNTWDTLSNPRAWVRKALLRIYIDQRKRQRRGRELEIKKHLIPESYLDDGLNVWEDRQWVAQMLRPLSPAQRAVVELIVDGLRPWEIADLLGKTPETIRQHLAHAREKLKANLGPDYQVGSAASPTPVRRKEDTR
jgi:RNA polymerase sigma factor (sigma-70 family)